MTSLIIKTMTVLCNVKDRMLGNRVEARTFAQIMGDVLTPDQFNYLATEIERKINVIKFNLFKLQNARILLRESLILKMLNMF